MELSAITYICNSQFYLSENANIGFWVNKLYQSGMKYRDNKAIGDSLNMRARKAHMSGDQDKALEYLLKALNYYLETTCSGELISCYNGLGVIHLAKGEFADARSYLELDVVPQYPADQILQH